MSPFWNFSFQLFICSAFPFVFNCHVIPFLSHNSPCIVSDWSNGVTWSHTWIQPLLKHCGFVCLKLCLKQHPEDQMFGERQKTAVVTWEDSPSLTESGTPFSLSFAPVLAGGFTALPAIIHFILRKPSLSSSTPDVKKRHHMEDVGSGRDENLSLMLSVAPLCWQPGCSMSSALWRESWVCILQSLWSKDLTQVFQYSSQQRLHEDTQIWIRTWAQSTSLEGWSW